MRASKVWVVDQIDLKTGRLDEHKVMLGFAREAAIAAYDKSFSDGSGGSAAGRGAVAETMIIGLKRWLVDGNTTQRFDQQKGFVPSTNARESITV